MVGITETFVLSGTKGMSVKVTVTEDYDNLANTSDIQVTAEVVSSVYSGHIYYLDGAVIANGQTLRTMSSFGGTHFVYVQQTNTPFPIARGGGNTVDTPWELPNIAHETDGSKTITVSIQLTGEEANGRGADGWTVTGSREITLTHIPRASTVAATNAVVGAVSMVAVSRKSSDYTHSVRYRFGNLTGYLCPQGLSAEEVCFTDTSIAFTIPESFYTQIPNAKSGSCTLICRTYHGEHPVGEAQSSSFTVTTEETACKPLLSGTVADTNPATLALTADANTLVRYMSSAKCTVTAQARNNAVITEKTIAGYAVTEETLTVNAVERNTMVFTATDSRGYRTELLVEKKWIPYIHVTCHAEGKRTDPTSGNAKLFVSGDYFAGSFGNVGNSLTLRYRIDGGEWNRVDPVVKNNKYTAEVTLIGLNYLYAYTLQVQAIDKLQTAETSVIIGKGIPVFDWGENDFSFHVPVHCEAGGTGFAPASLAEMAKAFGINIDYIQDVPNNNFNTLTGNSIYKGLHGNATGFPDGMGEWAFVLTLHYDDGSQFGVQFAWDMNDNTLCQRYKRNGTWNQWECHNPRMAMGVEYRTTERHDGKPVYTMLVNCGTVAIGTNTITHNIGWNMIRCSATIGGVALPYMPYGSNHDYNAAIGASRNQILITVPNDLVGATAFVTLWYIKE